MSDWQSAIRVSFAANIVELNATGPAGSLRWAGNTFDAYITRAG